MESMFDKELVLDIDSDVVFKTIQEDIPQMINAVVKMIGDIHNNV